jgi:hypothetical protein
MKTLFISILVAGAFIACNNQSPTTENAEEATAEQLALNFYGDTITLDGAVDVETFKTKIAGVDSMPVKLEATINETCKVKGCWMTVDLGNGEEMRVRFKDYGFFVPTEGANGKVVVMEGYAFTDTISVDHLKHLAEDAGKTAEEIAAISEPEIGVNFEATGVIIKD